MKNKIAFNLTVEQFSSIDEYIADLVRVSFINQGITVDDVINFDSKTKTKKNTDIKEIIDGLLTGIVTDRRVSNHHVNEYNQFINEMIYDLIAYINDSIKDSMNDDKNIKIGCFNGKEVYPLNNIDILTTMIYDLYNPKEKDSYYYFYSKQLKFKICKVLLSFITDNEYTFKIINIQHSVVEELSFLTIQQSNMIIGQLFNIYKSILVMDYSSMTSFENIYRPLAHEIILKYITKYFM